MLHLGSRDIGFAGADWVVEKGAELVELFDTALDPVRIVAAAAPRLFDGDRPASAGSWSPPIRAASPAWLERRDFDGRVVRSYGATEVFPPEDADCIVDNTATGATLKANGLVIFDELMRSSTRLYACPRALEQPSKRARIEHFVVLVRSVLDARKRVMLEVNVPADRLESVVASPTLHARADDRAAAPRCRLRGEGRRPAGRPAGH